MDDTNPSRATIYEASCKAFAIQAKDELTASRIARDANKAVLDAANKEAYLALCDVYNASRVVATAEAERKATRDIASDATAIYVATNAAAYDAECAANKASGDAAIAEAVRKATSDAARVAAKNYIDSIAKRDIAGYNADVASRDARAAKHNTTEYELHAVVAAEAAKAANIRKSAEE